MIELEQAIRDLAKIANPSEGKIQEILKGWLNHFNSFGVREADYANEFNATMKLRVSTGSISIMPPLNGEPV